MDKMNVVAVDDDLVNLEIILKNVSDMGHSAIGFGNGAEAWNYLQQNVGSFDIIVIDKMMPVMDGNKLLRNIRAHPMMERVPVIMQTADTREGKYGEAIQDGVDFYIMKPYLPEKLATFIKAAIRSMKMEEKKSFVDMINDEKKLNN